jgi:hypothetical protein
MKQIMGDGERILVPRYEKSRDSASVKTAKTKIGKCLECGHETTIMAKQAAITVYLNSDCRNCKSIKAKASKEARIAERAARLAEEAELKRQKAHELAKLYERTCCECGVSWVATRKSVAQKHRCPDCQSHHEKMSVKKRTYGLTSDELKELLPDGKATCANPGCRKPLDVSASKKWDKPCVDHDHETGEVRGILCHACNFGLGHLGDDLSRIAGLLLYIEGA